MSTMISKRTKLKIRAGAITALTVLVLTGGTAVAQDDVLAVTMTILPEQAEAPDDVLRDIELPPDVFEDSVAAEQGEANSQTGRDTADAARLDGREFGEEARELAEDNRERFGRGGERGNTDAAPDDLPVVPENTPNLPENVPDVPGL